MLTLWACQSLIGILCQKCSRCPTYPPSGSLTYSSVASCSALVRVGCGCVWGSGLERYNEITDIFEYCYQPRSGKDAMNI